MATNKITCASKAQLHRHILAVGGPAGRWTVDQARAALARGDVFYTVSPSTGRVALVSRYTCHCGVETLRSAADADKDNNLDYLPNCS